MDILSNTILQFIITNSIAFLALGVSVITLWIGARRVVQISLLYETIPPQEFVDPSHESVKAILPHLNISPDDERLQFLTWITFKLSNSGKVAITLADDTKPVMIAFRKRTILDFQEVAKDPKELEYTSRLDKDKILLTLPLLKPGESVTLKVLLTDYVFSFPDIDVRVPQHARIVKANNIRRSNEMLILGLFYLCAASYMFIAGRSIPSFIFQGVIGLSFLGGLAFISASWLDRRSLPYHHMLPSQYFLAFFLSFIYALPLLIPLALVALFIYFLLGTHALAIMFLIFIMVSTIFSLWWGVYKGFTKLLRWRKKTYNHVLIGFIASIPSLAFLALCIIALLELLYGR